jgi:hypothetical protein
MLNQPARVKLLKDKPFEGSSTYGKYLLYSVEHDGVEKAYFATEEVHEEMQAHGLKRGDEIVLTKLAQQNGRRVVPRIQVAVVSRTHEPPSPPPPKSQTGAEIAKSYRNPLEDATETPSGLSDGLFEIMQTSLKEAVEITRTVSGVPFQNEDIQKIASCLFIARTRMSGQCN